MSLNTSSAQKEYFARPASERFWGVEDMMVTLKKRDSLRRESTFNLDCINPVATSDGDLALEVSDGGERSMVGLNHWTFDQLCRLLDMTPEAERRRADNPELLALNFRHAMGRVSRGLSPLLSLPNPDDIEDEPSIIDGAFGRQKAVSQKSRQLKILAEFSPILKRWDARSITAPSYGRVFDSKLMSLASRALDYGFVTPRGWAHGDDPRNRTATQDDVFPCSIIQAGEKIGPCGAYADDRSSFLYLVRPVEVGPGLFPFLIVRNSEVGEVGTLDALCGLLGRTCGNHGIFNARDLQSVSVRHKREAIESFGERFNELLELEQKAKPINPALLRALGSTTLGNSPANVVDNVFKSRASIGLPLVVSRRFLELATEQAEANPGDWNETAQPLTYWWLAQGMTRASQIPVGSRRWQGGRLSLDRAAGQLLDSFDRSGLAVSESVPAVIDVTGSVVSTTPAKRGRKAIANN